MWPFLQEPSPILFHSGVGECFCFLNVIELLSILKSCGIIKYLSPAMNPCGQSLPANMHGYFHPIVLSLVILLVMCREDIFCGEEKKLC